MMQREGPNQAPNLVIDVDNREVALIAVKDAGGTTGSDRRPVGDMGFTASFTVTEGNLVGLWENA